MSETIKLLDDFSRAYGDIENTDRYYTECWGMMPKWIAALQNDIEATFNRKTITRRVDLILHDPSFKQSASTFIAFLHFLDEWDNFVIRCECMIDHSRVSVSVKGQPSRNGDLMKIADFIEKMYGNNYEASLTKLMEQYKGTA